MERTWVDCLVFRAWPSIDTVFKHKGERAMWREEDFQQTEREAFRTILLFWFPTAEMLKGYRCLSAVVLPLRIILGWIPVCLPGGLSRYRARTFGLVGAPLNASFLERWGEIAQRLNSPSQHLHPATVCKSLLPSLSVKRAIRVEATPHRELHYCLIYRQDDGGGIFAKRIIRGDIREAYHDMVFADPAPGGLSGELLFHAMRFYLQAGVRKVRLSAGFNISGLLWPKFGFHPESSGMWQLIHQKIRNNLQTLPLDIQSAIHDEVELVLADPDPRAIWGISELRNWSVQMGEYSYSAGDLLLLRTRWKGILDVDDPSAAARLISRLGRERGQEIRRMIERSSGEW